MATNSLNLQINVNSAQAAAAVNQLLRQFNQLNGVNVSAAPLQGITRAAPGAASGIRGITAAAAGLAAALAGVGAAFKKGLNFNANIESAEIGFQALIASVYELRDASGKKLEGPEMYAGAAQLAKEEIDQLRIAGLQTTATIEQLSTAMRSAIGPGAGANLLLADTRKLTIGIVQAAAAMTVPMDQLTQEVRSIFAGDITGDSTVGKLLFSNEDIQRWKQQGTLVAEMTKKLQPYIDVAELAANTWTGLTATIGEATSTLLGGATKGAFDALKKSIKGALDGAFDMSDGTISDSFKVLQDALGGAFTAVGTELADGISGAVSAAQELSTWLTENRATVMDMSNSVGVVWDNFKGIVSTVAEVIFGVGQAGTEAGVFTSVLNSVAIVLAMIQDGFRLIKLLVAEAGAFIVDEWNDGLKNVLRNVRSILSAIPLVGDSLTAAFDALVKKIPKNGNNLRAEAAAIRADFEAGNTAVKKTNAAIANGGRTAKAAAILAQRERDKAAKAAGGVTEKAKKQKPSDDEKKAADALKKSLEQIAKAEADADRTRFKSRQERLKAALDLEVAQLKKNRKEELDARLQLELDANKKEQQLADDNVRLLERKRASEKEPAKRNDITAELRKAEAELDALLDSDKVIRIRAEIDKVELQRELDELAASVRLDIGELMGLSSTSVDRIQSELQKLLDDPKIRGNSALEDLVKQRAGLQIDAANFNSAQSELQRLQTETANAEQRIQLAHQSGAITGIELEEQLAAARTKNVEALRAQLVIMRDLAKTSEQKAQVDSALLALDELVVKSQEAGNTAREALKDDFKDAFGAVLAGGTSLGRELGNALAAGANRGMKRLIDNSIDQLFSAVQGIDWGSLFGGASGGGGGGGWGGIMAGIGSFFGFAGGGYTGAGGKYDPAGIVHKGEWVVPKFAVERLRSAGQFGMLSHINRTGSMPKAGYVAGGLVGSAPGQLDLSGMGGGSTTVQNDIHNNMRPIISSDEVLRSMSDSGALAKEVIRISIEHKRRISRG